MERGLLNKSQYNETPETSNRQKVGSLLNKVPAITLMFWVTKLVSTALGESVSDFSTQIFGMQNQGLGELFTVAWSLGLFAIMLTLQFRSKKYNPFYYWTSVALLAVFGTFSADTLKALTGLHYLETTIIFLVLTIVGFVGWYLTTHDLSIHRITNHRQEAFYWITVAFTFMLGTAAGDWFATYRTGGYNVDPTGLGLGFLNTGIILTVVFLALVGYRLFAKPRENSGIEIFTFWAAYVLTRPIGASFADYLGYDFMKGVLGNNWMSVIGLIVFALTLVYMYRDNKRRDNGIISQDDKAA